MVGTHLSHYEILEELGRGGMGVVYKARDTKLDRLVAIKVLPRDRTRDPIANARFVHEAKAASALDHANICTIYAIDETDDGQMYIAMAYYDGDSLYDRIETGPLQVEQALNYAVQLGDGLSKAHDHEIVHRDIKPANVMITADGQVKIVDFGLAKVAEYTQVTEEGSTLGTASYMSPEQTRGEVIDARTDQWSMGTVLYEMLTGKKAFRGEYSQAIIYSLLNEEPIPVRELNPDVSPDLAAVVERMLKKEPGDRYDSVADATEQLKGLLNRERGLEAMGKPGVRGALETLMSPRFSIPAIVVVVGVIAFSLMQSKEREAATHARLEILPRIEEMMESTWSDYIDVYRLAEQAEEAIPDDSQLVAVLEEASRFISVSSEPPGADVYIKAYAYPDEEWQYLGVTPIEDVRMPVGVFRWRLEKNGYATVLAAATTWNIDPFGDDLILGQDFQRELTPDGELPDDMVHVPGFERPDGVVVEEFFIDKTEVTNRDFKAFITAGGYRNQDLWELEFVQDGDVIGWEDAMRLFVDQTGRPGPSTWQAGDYPEGQDNYPVSGVSFYEAAAYAKWVGKRLPTGTHWGRARGEYTPLIQWPQLGGFATFAPFSNFGRPGPVEVASLPGYTSFGAYDMAGNVREWCLNETDVGRLIRGGAWSDNTYTFSEPAQAPEMDRNERNGFRLALYPGTEQLADDVLEYEQPFEPPDFSNMEVVSDEVFDVYLQQFLYDDKPLSTTVESTKESDEWTLERVAFDSPYDNERIIGNLFLPTSADPPYQTVIYFPGSASMFQASSENIDEYYEFPVFLSYLVKNGRAVFYPTYYGTFERQDMTLVPLMLGANTFAYTEFITRLVKDFERSIEYLETRDDIDMDRLAYYGMSWGGLMGAIIPAVEPRLKTAVLLPPTFHDEGRPEVNQVNYVPRITIPMLMLAGEYDARQPPEVSIVPMYNMLGTPEEHKKLITYKTDHIPPMNEVIRETLDWLDIYLGPVR